MAIVFIPFVKSLSRRTAVYFVVAGAIFVGGAIGLEFVGATVLRTGFVERGDLIDRLLRVFEEAFEMFGIGIFNCALIREIVSRNLHVGIKFSTEGVNQEAV